MSTHRLSRRAGGFFPLLPHLRSACFLPIFQKTGIRRRRLVIPSITTTPEGCPEWPQGHPIKECSCSASSIACYQKRISGPHLDRIDIHVDYEKLAGKRQVENSETIRKRVQAAREEQLERLKGTKLIRGYGYGRKLEMERGK